MRTFTTAALLLSLMLISCGDPLLGPPASNTPAGNFDLLWGEFDRYYALFDTRRADWDSLYRAYRPLVHDGMSDRDLFMTMRALLLNLNDAHVTLTAPWGTVGADTTFDDSSALHSRDLIVRRYLAGHIDTAGGGRIYHGVIGGRIGYIEIPSFEGRIEVDPGYSRWAEDIDPIMESFRDLDGVIIDIRDNDGGNTFNAAFIAGRFADRRRLYQISRSRSGPGHDEFTGPFERYVEPGGSFRFAGPVALLTNGRSISGAEWFTMAMKRLPNVTTVGDTTAGNLSGRMERELPNGWTYSIAVQKILSPDGICYEGIGIPPDIPASTTAADIARDRDPALEEALRVVGG
jgi:hypothetical protein